MNAARKELLVGIIAGLRTTNLADYPFELALSRLDEYYMAGTIKGALTFITTHAAVQEKASDVAIEKLPLLTKTTAEIVDLIGALHDAIFFPEPSVASLDQTLLALDQDPKKFPSKVSKQEQLKQMVRDVNHNPDLEKRQSETARFVSVFKASGLLK